ncbi:unnamed protein product [Prorocentrum cordatum]|uniref:Uncharacterized protein n=1 Tax=Prorocentrum cordatum TaxID=2364126 RepID=A0ABN9X0M8_9DINO|nr:unnamed protein product [Polarella glacialis]
MTTMAPMPAGIFIEPACLEKRGWKKLEPNISNAIPAKLQAWRWRGELGEEGRVDSEFFPAARGHAPPDNKNSTWHYTASELYRRARIFIAEIGQFVSAYVLPTRPSDKAPSVHIFRRRPYNSALPDIQI